MFDPTCSKKRLVPGSVLVGGEPVQTDRKYTLCTKQYIADGHDGYDVFKVGSMLNTNQIKQSN